MANETFEHVVKQLKKNQTENSSGLEAVGKTVAALNDRMNKFFEGLAQQRLDDLEDRREQRKESNKVAAATGGTTTKDAKGINFLPLLFSKTGLVGSLLAVGGALSGLRGWEVSALKAIKNIKLGVGENLTNKFISLRASILGGLGLDATLKRFNAPGSGLATPITTQIIDKFKGLRTNILKVFGLGADGKPIVVRGADGLFKTPVISRVTTAVGTLLSPLKFVADGIMTFFKTAGAGTFAFLKTIGIVGGAGALIAGGTGVIAKVIGAASRILFPIGVIMGLFNAFTKYKESEEAVGYKRFADGIGGFLESFLGAPLDMIKNLIVSGLNLIGIGVNDDGTPNDFSKMIKNFSIGETLAKLPKALVNVVEAVIKGVVDLAKDPIGVGAKIITGIGNALQTAFINVMKLVIANFPGMERFAPKILQTDARKKINELKEQERILSGTLMSKSPADETQRMQVIRRLTKKAELEEMIRAGDFEQASILQKLFGLGSRITNEQEAKEALKVLADSKAADVLALQKFQQQTQEFVTLNSRLMDTASDIQDLTKALKENPNLVVDNKDLSSTTNNSYTNSQAMITQDNLGFNPDNFEFRAVR